jgi:hypothetical protein
VSVVETLDALRRALDLPTRYDLFERVRDACNRGRPFYQNLKGEYETVKKAARSNPASGEYEYQQLQRLEARLRRLGIYDYE